MEAGIKPLPNFFVGSKSYLYLKLADCYDFHNMNFEKNRFN